jgi:isocitrate dehydrogenase
MEYVNIFKARNSEFKQRTQDEIKHCRAENIILGDEQDKLLQKIETEIVVYQSQIVDEWRAIQGKS